MVKTKRDRESKTTKQRRYLAIKVSPLSTEQETLESIESKTVGSQLNTLGEWAFAYTPLVSIEPPDIVLLDIYGVTHLWGGEQPYALSILKALQKEGIYSAIAIASTVALAKGAVLYPEFIKRSSITNKERSITILKEASIIILNEKEERELLKHFPIEALQLEELAVERLHKVGIKMVEELLKVPSTNLQRRFGKGVLEKIREALGEAPQPFTPLSPTPKMEVEVATLQPITRAEGIEVALEKLLKELTELLKQKGVGVRRALLNCYRVDGAKESISIGTATPTLNEKHLLELFKLKIGEIEPALGIELFKLEATLFEKLPSPKERELWEAQQQNRRELVELFESIEGRLKKGAIKRYLPYHSYIPERSFKEEPALYQGGDFQWGNNKLRPLHLLPTPLPIEVSLYLPGSPPLQFKEGGKVVQLVSGDGPEIIEEEWWRGKSGKREYYRVESREGIRYWIFREVDQKIDQSQRAEKGQWYIHGYFA